MTKLRQLWLLTALGSVAALVMGHFLLVSPKADKAAKLREEASTQQTANGRLRSQIKLLNEQRKDLPRQQAELAKFAGKIPNNPALPALIRSLSDAADNAGVELVSMAPGAMTPVATGAEETRASGTGTTRTAGTAVTAATLPLAAMPISIQVTGNYGQMSQFLAEVEGLPRAFLVNGFSVAPGDASPAGKDAAKTTAASDVLTVSLTGQLFMTTKAAPAAPTTADTAAATTTKAAK
jgi:Tfp pilus assembly protein PilO